MAPEATVPYVLGYEVTVGCLASEQTAVGCPSKTVEWHGLAVHRAQPQPVGEVQADNGPAGLSFSLLRLAACLANAAQEPRQWNQSTNGL